MTITIGDMQGAHSLTDFIQKTVSDWLSSDEYTNMKDAKTYYFGENPVLKRNWNRITLDTGGSLSLKPKQNIYSNFFGRLVKQLVNRLLYHGIKLDDESSLLRLGANFQESTRQIAYDAAICKVGWGFWQNGEVVPIPAEKFVPIVDDFTGSVIAGIYFWRLDENRPLIYQLFEADGVTTWEQAKRGGKLEQTTEKTPYRYKEFKWDTGDGVRCAIADARGYGELPIVPMYANVERRSELTVPIKTKINAYDMLNTFYADEFLQSKFVYWMISGYSGNVDELVAIRDTIRKLGIIAAETGQDGKIAPQTLEPPYNAHKEIMQALEREIFRDAMLFNPEDIAGSANIATAIKAGQYPEDVKVKSFEHEVEQFVRGVMRVAGAMSTG